MNPISAGDVVPRFQPYKSAIALCLIAAAVYVWWPHRTFAPANPVSSRPFIMNEFSADTEQAWMARLIGRDMLEVIAYATTHKHPVNMGLKFEAGTTFNGKKHRFTASFDGMAEKQQIVLVDDYFWSPATFAPWASALLNTAHLQISKAPDQLNAEFLTALTNPMPETLIREDQRLSDALTKDPLNAELHEEAALLIGSFAMRECAASPFCDIRRYLCKLSAHLALAKAIRGNLGASGNLAEAILCSLCGRETRALSIVDQLQRDAATGSGIPGDVATSWARAVHLRNTGDYRILDQPEKASLLERLEYVRALRFRVGNTAASEFVATHDLERLPEWSQIILVGSISVAGGNRWAVRALEMELEASAAHYRNYFGQQMAQSDFANALNVEWGRFSQTDTGHPTLHVLGWGAWAEQHQRQVCELIQTMSYWLGQMLGLSEDAADFESKITSEFQSLHFFPLIHFYTHYDDPTNKLHSERVRKVVTDHREWVTFYRWGTAAEVIRRLSPRVASASTSQNRRGPKQRPPEPGHDARANKSDPLMSSRSWFNPMIPFGTLYDLYNRVDDGALSNWSIAELEAAKALAPSNRNVLWAHLTRTTNSKPTSEQTEAEFDRLSGYDVSAMKIVANAFQSDPVKYAQKYGALCWFDPDRYTDLGDYLVDHSDETGAAQAYQNAFDHATDRVLVSNSMEWLVNYYYDHGKREEASRIASEGAEVYSQVGLVTMASLLDRMSKLDEAEWYLKKAQKRYPNTTKNDLLDFYARNRDKSASYAAAENELRAALFPKGIERVTLANFHDPPTDGVILNNASERTAKGGLQTGDIFVSLNGYRIHSMEQYTAARHPNNDPNVRFILWRGGKYTELDAFFPKRRDTSRFSSYSARAVAGH